MKQFSQEELRKIEQLKKDMFALSFRLTELQRKLNISQHLLETYINKLNLMENKLKL